MADQKRFQMIISDKGLRELKELQDKVEQRTMADLIRSSIKVYKYLQEQRELGNEVIIRDKNGKEKELLI